MERIGKGNKRIGGKVRQRKNWGEGWDVPRERWRRGIEARVDIQKGKGVRGKSRGWNRSSHTSERVVSVMTTGSHGRRWVFFHNGICWKFDEAGGGRGELRTRRSKAGVREGVWRTTWVEEVQTMGSRLSASGWVGNDGEARRDKRDDEGGVMGRGEEKDDAMDG
ncbi:hypothetical protein AMTR_s00064p00154290 [Amborella trichopoda]|uniref:Uncharacterized protein n=1 Tax=Amborella trichopoda TaxID=13333 RepID=U5D2E6_AMBTC|nr:hypothetical protein AMTR_s00064p00154290 [Amborella trichopoda]